MISAYRGISPTLGDQVYLAETCVLTGDIRLGNASNVWFGAVIRGDVNRIAIGSETNIQDQCVLHVTADYPLTIGNQVTVGHAAVLHGCTLGDRVLIGIGACVLDGAFICEDSLVAAGSLVVPRSSFPRGVLIAGAPAKVKRELRPDELAELVAASRRYVSLAGEYRKAQTLAGI